MSLCRSKAIRQRPAVKAQASAAGDGGDAAKTPSPLAAAAKCPVLSSLPRPPLNPVPFWPPLREVVNVAAYCGEVLAGGPAARGLLFSSEFTLVSGAEAWRAAWAAESQGALRPAWDIPDVAWQYGPESLLFVNGEKHAALRRLMAPAFTPEQATRAAPLMARIVRRYLQEWAEADEVNVAERLKRMTFEIINNVFLGLNFNEEEITQYLGLFDVYLGGLIAPIPLWFPFGAKADGVRAKGEIIKLLEGKLEAMKREVQAGVDVGVREGTVLHTLTVGALSGQLTTDQVTQNMLLLLHAGHDTTSNALAFLMQNLTRADPSILSALRGEQTAVIASQGQGYGGAVLKAMPYVDAVLQENLRMLSIVPISIRVADKDFEVSGYRVAAGDKVMFPFQYDIAHDPRWHPSDASLPPELHPCRFNPSRWSSPASKQPGGTFFPFGGGAHVCLGANLANTEMKVFLSELVRGYDFQAETSVGYDCLPLAQPKGGRLMARLVPRGEMVVAGDGVN